MGVAFDPYQARDGDRSAIKFSHESFQKKPFFGGMRYESEAREEVHVSIGNHQQQRVYDWQRALFPAERDDVPHYGPIPDELQRFYARAWRWGSAWCNSGMPRPRLEYDPELQYAGMARRRLPGWPVQLIVLGPYGVKRRVLLHEIAHALAYQDRHGSHFARVALDLYVHFLGVDPRRALMLAHQCGVEIAADAQALNNRGYEDPTRDWPGNEVDSEAPE